MPSFKTAYLIHGDDHGRIGERRARLRALAEGSGGAGSLEVLENATPLDAARALVQHVGERQQRLLRELEKLCLESRGVQSHLNGLQIAKVIVVPDKLVNVVVR